MGVECPSGSNSMEEYLKLKTKLYGFGGSYESENEVIKDKKRLEELGMCDKSIIKIIKLKNKIKFQKKYSNYIDYMDNNGLSEDIKLIILKLWNNLGLKPINKQNEKGIYDGFVLLLKLFADMESGGRNIENNNGSSAKGYFQYLNGYNKEGEKNEKYDKNKGIYTPFETALRRLNKYYVPEEKYPTFNNKKLPKWVKYAYNKEGFNPIDLTLEQQTILFLVDLLSKTKKVLNKKHILVGMKDFLPLAIDGNEWGVKKIYYIFHHTNPDKATKKRIREKINLYRTTLMALNKK